MFHVLTQPGTNGKCATFFRVYFFILRSCFISCVNGEYIIFYYGYLCSCGKNTRKYAEYT